MRISVNTFLELVLFGLVGIVGTGAHYLALIVLVEAFGVDPIVATTIGFVLGAGINYSLNHRYTFRSTKAHLDAGPKFFLIAGVTGLLNTLFVYTGIHWMGLDYLFAQIVSTVAVFLANFVLNRAWTFRDPYPTRQGN
jgi:putative flippase GtrA